MGIRNSARALLAGLALAVLAACGVEGPPVPPQNATMQQHGAFPAMTGTAQGMNTMRTGS